MTKSGLRRFTSVTARAQAPGSWPPVRSDMTTKRKASDELTDAPRQPAMRLRSAGELVQPAAISNAMHVADIRM